MVGFVKGDRLIVVKTRIPLSQGRNASKANTLVSLHIFKQGGCSFSIQEKTSFRMWKTVYPLWQLSQLSNNMYPVCQYRTLAKRCIVSKEYLTSIFFISSLCIGDSKWTKMKVLQKTSDQPSCPHGCIRWQAFFTHFIGTFPRCV